ncbi:hypothetical protein ACLMJK_004780 [Lecanora helva]
MITTFLLSIIPTILLLNHPTTALPQSPPSPLDLATNLTTNLTAPTYPTLRCHSRPLLPFTRDPRPLFSDCTYAIGILPFTHTLGTFHTGYPNNQFELPLRRFYRGCMVGVELVNPRGGVGGGVKSRWMDIRAAAQHLNVDCKGRGEAGRTGGWSGAGEGGGIRVTLEGSQVRDTEGDTSEE